MASTVWNGYLTFGLISIPIKLSAAARSEKISFNQLHKQCNTRIKQQTRRPACEEIVARSDIVKGYEYATDSYVLVSDEEIKKLAPPSAETREILEFVKLSEIDPLHYDSSYSTVPEAPGRTPYQLLVDTMNDSGSCRPRRTCRPPTYQLLVDTMKDSGYAAIAKIAMHQREYTALIRPRRGGLTLHTMYYADDIREVEGYGRQSGVELKPREAELAKLVESLAMTAPAPKKPAAREEAREAAVKAPDKRRRVKTRAAG